MSSNFERLHEIINEAYAENFSILSQKLANPPLYLALHFLIGIPFIQSGCNYLELENALLFLDEILDILAIVG